MYVPPKLVFTIYKALLLHTNSIVAESFLKANEHTFDAFCLRCWIHGYVKHVAMNDSIPYKTKLKFLNDHMTECFVDVSPAHVVRWMGAPSLN